MLHIAEQFMRATLALDRIEVKDILLQTTADYPGIEIIEKIIVPVLETIGYEWEQGRIALAQVYMSGRICEEIVDQVLIPGTLVKQNNPSMAIVVLQDHHMLGKRIVYSLLRASGFELSDYGSADVPTLLKKIGEDDPKILLVSTLMLSSALLVKELITQLKDNGRTTKIIVGGAPFRFDESLWKDVGADAMGKSASDALTLVKELTRTVEL